MPDPYRDEGAAVRQKLAEISSELEHIDAAVARSHALRAEARELQMRLEQLRQRDPLENVRIASPCSADWNRMTGDDRVRFCGDCNKNVYSTAGMTRAETRELLTQHAGGELCLRIYRRADGTILTSDCSVGANDRKKKVRRLAIAAGAFGALSAAAYAELNAARMGGVARTGEARIETGDIELLPADPLPQQPLPSASASGSAKPGERERPR